MLVELIADTLSSRQVLTPADAVVQRLISDVSVFELAFEILVAIDTKLGRIGEIGAELDKERSEVFIQAVEIVEVHVGAGVIDPWDRTVTKKCFSINHTLWSHSNPGSARNVKAGSHRKPSDRLPRFGANYDVLQNMQDTGAAHI